MNRVSKKYGIRDWKKRSSIHALVLETVRRKNVIDRFLSLALKSGSIHKTHPILRNILRVATYEMKFTMTSPQLATDTAVKIGKEKLGEKQSKFISVLLGEIEKIGLRNLYREFGDIERDSLRYYFPVWFVKYLIKLFGGRNSTINFLQKSNTLPRVFIRVNTLKITRKKLIRMMEKEGIKCKVDTDLEDVIEILKTEKPIVRHPLHYKGFFTIQDKSSALASHILHPNPGETVLDICAAPGSKTTHLAQLMKNNGKIVAIDISQRRMKELIRRTKEFGIKIVQPIVMDAKMLNLKRKFDKICVDPPCSSTGVLWSRPSQRWRITKRLIEKFSRLQYDILSSSANFIREGGQIIYSTCSVTIEENEMVIEKFLKHNPDFQLKSSDPMIGQQGFRGLTECQRLFPHKHGTEGFFIATMVC